MRIVREPLSAAEIRVLAEETFRDMIKVVVDVRRGVMVAGGALHSDGEELLLEDGSQQADLWGANFYPGKAVGKRMEYTSLINQYHADNKGSQEIASPGVREQVRAIVARHVGSV